MGAAVPPDVQSDVQSTRRAGCGMRAVAVVAIVAGVALAGWLALNRPTAQDAAPVVQRDTVAEMMINNRRRSLGLPVCTSFEYSDLAPGVRKLVCNYDE